jgi:hypothetical protein
MATLAIAVERLDDAVIRLRKAQDELPPGQFRRLIAQDPALEPLRRDARFASVVH